MKPGARAGLIVSGIVLLYGALLIPGFLSLHFYDFYPILPQIVFVLATAALLFTGGYVLTSGRLALAGAVTAVFFYLFNPVILQESLTPDGVTAAHEAFFALLFCLSWVWMRNWSAFMRSVAQTVLFAVGLWLDIHACLWIAVAMIPWIIFNRRPLVSAGTLLAMTLGGTLIYFVGHGFSFYSPLLFWRDDLTLLGEPLATSVTAVSLPWMALALWGCIERLRTMVMERRAGVESYIAGLVVFLFLKSSFIALVVAVTLSVPLVAADITHKEFLLNRGARWSAFFGFISMAGLFLVMDGLDRPGIGLEALCLVGALLFSRFIPSVRKLDYSKRIRSVLAGASVGASLGVVLLSGLL